MNILKHALEATELCHTSKLRAYYFICLQEPVFSQDKSFFLKGLIDRLHVTFDILVKYSLFFVRFLLADQLYVRLALLYHEFKQFGSLHICAPRKMSAAA